LLQLQFLLQADVFLISLKAGGVGLNLTEADTVIHYDPWWNPAVENRHINKKATECCLNSYEGMHSLFQQLR
jgi:hypothetical protein